ncbi:alanine--tRNA ligase [Bacteroidota bacterium]
MNFNKVRNTFFDFFKSKQHQIIPSSPMVIKNDPTLMFTNAGMNQFKDIFLGNAGSKFSRIANTQKCLRVSGKHNDLEEVGHDTYHHTMFEMLGNWSFGDYFKKEAIEWAWELLTDVYKIDKNNLYATVYGGDNKDGLEKDNESYQLWKSILPEDHIIFGSKKDNFWEMGDTGPCGPCSEIHIDIRDETEKVKVKGHDLVNKDHPQVIEIWNLVFIEYNRQANSKLVTLPQKHVDTGMGFERLCMILQGKKSNYDTDIFQPLIGKIADMAGKTYGESHIVDTAIRVIADHLRAVAFAIADGQIPSNIKAGYVIRRILRRAIRYGYTFLDFKEPFINELAPLLVNQMGSIFPEMMKQGELIKKVIHEEEVAFLRTLSNGIQRFDQYVTENPDKKEIEGLFAFELFDTYGFPVDLTQLIAAEKELGVDMNAFDKELQTQKSRSRNAAAIDADDWIEIYKDEKEEFIGYDHLETEIKITRYRKVKTRNKEFYQLVFNITPFYAESGGQVGDTGYIESNDDKIRIFDTQKENNLIIHYAEKLPKFPSEIFKARVDRIKREHTAANHSATHLMHEALRALLGTHVEQKGSLVDEKHLRFDFSHYQKLSKEEIAKVEAYVNHKIRQNLLLEENKDIPMKEASDMGAIAFFGEKYGDLVRVIKFGDSVELCGGTHVKATGQIGYFKVVSESAIAAGIRRIEAITSENSEIYINQHFEIINELKELLKSQKDIVKGVKNLYEQKNQLEKELEQLKKEKAKGIQHELFNKSEEINGIHFIAARVDLEMAVIKDLAFKLKQTVDNLFLIIGSEANGKANLTLMISDKLVKEKGLHAGNLIRKLSKEINGGGGGQPHFATAGGTNPDGILNVLESAKKIIQQKS